jgi:hypothetical protein
MASVPDTLTNGKPDPDFLDWMAGAEACHAELSNGKAPAVVAFENWATGEEVYTDEPDFGRPTPEEEREGAEICAAWNLDSFLPRNPSFKCFLAEQARLAKIRDNDANWEWLGNLLTEHAARAMFVKARTAAEYDARVEVMSGNHEAKQAVEMVRIVAGLLDHPFRAAADELHRAADRLDRFMGPLS